MTRIIRTNGTPGTIGAGDTMYQIGTDGVIVAGHFDDTTVIPGMTVARWTVPIIHTEVTIRRPAKPSQAARAAIAHLLDQLIPTGEYA